jgi:hypothetical protein
MSLTAQSLVRTIGTLTLGAMLASQAAAYTATTIDGATVNAQTLAQSLLSANSNITINSVSYQGANIASGLFTGGSSIFGIDNGVVLTTGNANTFDSNQNGVAGAPILKPLTTGSTADASILTIRFTPVGNQIQFTYAFGSREYPSYVDSQYNDVFGMFVNGTNYALVPNTTTPVAINNINCGDASGAGAMPNCALFVDNRNGDQGLPLSALGGWTRALTFSAPVNPGVENELVIAIADVGDESLDSAAFIAGGTLGSCGGAGQPVCGGGAPVRQAIELPLMSPAQTALMAMLFALFASWQVRRRKV